MTKEISAEKRNRRPKLGNRMPADGTGEAGVRVELGLSLRLRLMVRLAQRWDNSRTYRPRFQSFMNLKLSRMILLGAIMGLLVPAWSCEERKALPALGEPCPRHTLSDLTQGTVTVPDDFRGRVLVVRFWSDCCSYNIHEMEGLGSLYDKYAGRGLAVITVYSGATRAAALQFREELKIPYPVLLDIDSAVARQCGVLRLPTTLIIDRSGIIRGKIIGESERKAWTESYESLITRLL